MVFFFFFNGLSFHLSAAFASHLLGFKMSWGSTTKEVADTNFFKEVKSIAIKGFYPDLALIVCAKAGQVKFKSLLVDLLKVDRHDLSGFDPPDVCFAKLLWYRLMVHQSLCKLLLVIGLLQSAAAVAHTQHAKPNSRTALIGEQPNPWDF